MHESVEGLGADAITIGNHVAFAPGMYRPGTPNGDRLIGHEFAHVAQQAGGSGTPQASGLSYDGYEAEADRAAETALAGGVVPGLTPVHGEPTPQGGFWSRVGGALSSAADAVGDTVSSAAGAVYDAGAYVGRGIAAGAEFAYDNTVGLAIDALIDLFWRFVPDSVEGYLKDPGTLWDDIVGAITDGLGQLFGPFFRTLSGSGFLDDISEFFSGLWTAVTEIVAAVRANDCEALKQAIAPLSDAIGEIASDTFEDIQRVFGTIYDAIEPVVNFVSQLAGSAWDLMVKIGEALGESVLQIWEDIKWAVGKIVDAAEWVGDQIGALWDWFIEDVLGIESGNSSDSEGTIMSWIADGLSDLWNSARETVLGWVDPALDVVAALSVFTPFGPIIIAIRFGPRIVSWLTELWDVLSQSDAIAAAREWLSETFLPGLQSFLQELQPVFTAVGIAVGIALLPILGPFALLAVALYLWPEALGWIADAVQWLVDKIQWLIDWVVQTATAIFDACRDLFSGLWSWVKPVLEVMLKIVFIATNPLGIPLLVMSLAWQIIPDCIKGPLIDWILDVLIWFVEMMPEIPIIGAFHSLVKHGILGFLRNIREQDRDKKIEVSDRIARLMAGGSVDFVLGFLWGVVVGMWESLIGPFQIVWMILQIIPAMLRFFQNAITNFGSTFGSLVEGAAGLVTDVVDNFWPALEQLWQSGSNLTAEQIYGLIVAGWEAILGVAERIGAGIANAIFNYLLNDDFTLGKHAGWIVGTIAMEVALGILTSGGTTVLRGLSLPVRAVATVILKAHQIMNRVFGVIIEHIPLLSRGLRAFMGFMDSSPIMARWGQSLGRLFSGLDDAARNALQRLGFQVRSGPQERLFQALIARNTPVDEAAEIAARHSDEAAEDLARTMSPSGAPPVLDDAADTAADASSSAPTTTPRATAEPPSSATDSAPARAPEPAPTSAADDVGERLDDAGRQVDEVGERASRSLDERLQTSRFKERVDDLTPEELADEITWVQQNRGRIRRSDRPGYTHETDLPNDHVYRVRDEPAPQGCPCLWQRFSDTPESRPPWSIDELSPTPRPLDRAAEIRAREALLAGVPDNEVGEAYRRYIGSLRRPTRSGLSFTDFHDAWFDEGVRPRPTAGGVQLVNPEGKVRRPSIPRQVPRSHPDYVPANDAGLLRPAEDLRAITQNPPEGATNWPRHAPAEATVPRASGVSAVQGRNLVTVEMEVRVLVGGEPRTLRFHFTEQTELGSQRRLFFASGSNELGGEVRLDSGTWRGVSTGEIMEQDFPNGLIDDPASPNRFRPAPDGYTGPRIPASEARARYGVQFTAANADDLASLYRHSETAMFEMLESRPHLLNDGILDALRTGPPPMTDAELLGRLRVEGVQFDLASTRSVCEGCARGMARLQGEELLANADEAVQQYARRQPGFATAANDALDQRFFVRGERVPVDIRPVYEVPAASHAAEREAAALRTTSPEPLQPSSSPSDVRRAGGTSAPEPRFRTTPIDLIDPNPQDLAEPSRPLCINRR